jgi:hypothetical protein
LLTIAAFVKSVSLHLPGQLALAERWFSDEATRRLLDAAVNVEIEGARGIHRDA